MIKKILGKAALIAGVGMMVASQGWGAGVKTQPINLEIDLVKDGKFQVDTPSMKKVLSGEKALTEDFVIGRSQITYHSGGQDEYTLALFIGDGTNTPDDKARLGDNPALFFEKDGVVSQIPFVVSTGDPSSKEVLSLSLNPDTWGTGVIVRADGTVRKTVVEDETAMLHFHVPKSFDPTSVPVGNYTALVTLAFSLGH